MMVLCPLRYFKSMLSNQIYLYRRSYIRFPLKLFSKHKKKESLQRSSSKTIAPKSLAELLEISYFFFPSKNTLNDQFIFFGPRPPLLLDVAPPAGAGHTAWRTVPTLPGYCTPGRTGPAFELGPSSNRTESAVVAAAAPI